MKTILVTGGAGFIGSNFVRMVLDKHTDWSVVNLDLLTYAGNLENLEGYIDNDRHVFVKGSICEAEVVCCIFEDTKIDAVVNFAAESHVDRSIVDSGVFIDTNVQGTRVLLEAAVKNKVGKFVQVSTDEVYGELGPEGYFTEQTPLSPNSPYSASKASADLLVAAFGHTYGLNYNITRCSNNYGPFQFPEKLIPLMINNALHDKKLPVYGDGLQVRDWLYVMDHCTAIWSVLTGGKAGQVYNIGGNNEYKNIDIVKTILQKLGKSQELIEYVTDRAGHDRRYAIDSSKIISELGWRPEVNFEDGIGSTIEWYLENSKWLAHAVSGQYQHYYQNMYERRCDCSGESYSG